MESKRRIRIVCLASAVALWIAAFALGEWKTTEFDNTPGRSASAPDRWPAGRSIALARDRATLLMFAHPRCPCTRASLSELESILAESPGRVAAHVVVFVPQGAGSEWTDGATVRTASAIEGLDVVRDVAGAEARRFGVRTSGETLVYDADGRLRFSGGVTRARGAVGASAGSHAVSQLAKTSRADVSTTATFGCPIFDDDAEPPCSAPSTDGR